MKIYQLIHTLSYGDAISGETLALHRCFMESGVESAIYSINTHPYYKKPDFNGQILSYQDFPPDFDGKVILHYSLGSPLNALFRSLNSAYRSIVFHNLTPAKYFADINPRVAADIEEGWHELPELCKLSDLVISDSAFNASELKNIGIDSELLHLPFDPARWAEQTNSGFVNLIKSDPGIHLLHIGRLAPNKCIEDIIKTFYFLRHKFKSQNSRLWLVGIDIDTELYSFGLKRLAQELSLTEYINFTGPLTDSEIKALYQNCSAYLCMSEHEGYCLPLVEAMYYGLPVLAYDCSAVGETVGDGGILFKEKKFPEIAELIYKISGSEQLRQRLSEAGRQRVKALSFDGFKQNVQKLLAI